MKNQRNYDASREAEAILFGDPIPSEPKRPWFGCWDRSDLIIGALGVTLAVTCAMFPWYIFFNQEKFGVRAFVFDNKSNGNGTPGRGMSVTPVGKAPKNEQRPSMELDFFPTATVSAREEMQMAAAEFDQPYPADLINFKLIHVANGRAMIQDEDGLWVVQKGSQLPDASRLVSIEQRDGTWAIITSRDGVISLTQ